MGNTTNLLVEYAITGLQVSATLLILAFIAFGVEWINFEKIEQLSFLIGVASIAVSYPLGIFVDEITDAVFDGIIQKTKKIYEISDRQSVMSIQNINSFQEQYFGILRMKMRISRSSVFTFAFLGVSLSVFCLVRMESYRIQLGLSFLALGALLAGLAWNAFLKSTDDFYRNLKVQLENT